MQFIDALERRGHLGNRHGECSGRRVEEEQQKKPEATLPGLKEKDHEPEESHVLPDCRILPRYSPGAGLVPL